MKKVLVTGFDPFGGETINPSLEAVKQLHGMNGDGFQVEMLEVPTVFNQSIEVLLKKMEAVEPDIVLCVGQAEGYTSITVERVAINVNDARIPDNEGNQLIDTPVIEGGPAAYFSTLPIKAMVKEMHELGIPARVSNSAGTFLCNHIFYGLMHHIATTGRSIRGGFIHIPLLPEQAIRHRGQPSMNLSMIVKGIERAVEASVKYKADVVMEGGELN